MTAPGRVAFGVIAIALQSCGHSPQPSRDEVLHANGKPCPTGWTLRPSFFTERDGGKLDACIANRDTPNVARGVTDELRPGESMSITGRIALPSRPDVPHI